MRVLIIGASAAGLKAACRTKRLLPAAQVTVLDEGEVISLAACGLPYYLSSDIEEFRSLTTTAYDVAKSPEYFVAVKGVEVLTGVRAERFDPERQKVHGFRVSTGEMLDFPYDELVIAVGAAPVIPPIEGVNLPGVCTFTKPTDAQELRRACQKNQLAKVAIIGAGFIGCELCEAFKALWGIETTLFEIEAQVLPNLLDAEVASIIKAEFERQGIQLALGAQIASVARVGEKLNVNTADGCCFEDFDRVIFTTGVKPRMELAQTGGIQIGALGGIMVDSALRTNVQSVCAAGDCVELTHALTGKPCLLPLGSLANRMGRVVGNVIAGQDDAFDPVLGTCGLKVFDLQVAATGLSEKAAREAGFQIGEAWGTFTDRAHYYPEAELLSAKLIYDVPSQRLLGMQVVGKSNVIRLVDSAAVMLQAGFTLAQMRNFEPAYAPPFANALDPLHFLSYAAVAAESENVRACSPLQAKELAAKSIVIDVREEVEVAAQPLPFNCRQLFTIPLTQIRRRLDEIPRDQPVLIICQRGTRSAEAVRILQAQGFKNVRYIGGGLGFSLA